jgi:16S rRNA C967 or C1407 C5-methylase (RsmB/RsmF family)
VTGHRQTALAIQKHLEEVLIPGLPQTGEDGSAYPVPSKIPWYPNGLGWNMKSDRKAIRSQPEYQAFHTWLKAATENGDISRQEAVSMIPPLLLGVKSDHLVLDMCAAPGSKTAQLVEMMHSTCAEGRLPTGMVIANDLDQKRAYLLHHQVKRILSPALMVTNNDGTFYPNIYEQGSEDALLFDRILADVPCSGDGTLRKNPGLWRDWSPAMGLGLHGLQVRILDRACQMTKVGGRIVYSTCSMNPLENEAVLATILSKYPGKVRLVDCSDALPELKRLPGVSDWKVTSKDGKTVYKSYEEVPEAERRRISESMFPGAENASLGLERAMRILPHLQDSGGFFIAVLEKVDELAANSYMQRKRKVKVEAAADDVGPSEKPANDPDLKPAEEEFFVVPKEHHNLRNIIESFGIDEARLGENAFVSRVDRDPIKSLAFVSPAIHRILAPGLNPNLRVINVGARAFEVYDPNCKRAFACPYRILTESASLFEEAGLLGKKRVHVSRDDLTKLIECEDSVNFDLLPSVPEETRALPEGGLVFIAQGKGGSPVIVPVWKGDRSVKAFIPKPNRPALLYQLLE